MKYVIGSGHGASPTLRPGWRKVLQGLCLAAGLILGETQAIGAAPEKTQYQFRGVNATSGSSISDECRVVYLDFGVFQNATHTSAGGRPTTANEAYFILDSSNGCTGEYSLIIGFGEGIAISTVGKKVVANGSFEVFNYPAGTVQTLVLDNLSFEPNGLYTSRGQNNNSFSTPYALFRSHSVGTFASANISGDIALDGTSILSTFGVLAGSISSYATGTFETIRR